MSTKRCVFLLTCFFILVSSSIRCNPYDQAVSLGYGCQVAWQMETHGLRKQAYPFDWFQTPFESLISFLEHKGANFLDWGKILSYGSYPGDPNFLKALDLVYGIYSYHDFHANPPFGNYAQVKEKYDRRVKRFFELLNSNKKVLFVRQGFTRAQVELLDFTLKKLYPKLRYTILAVNDSADYKVDWKLPRIKNYYIPYNHADWMGDFARWKEVLSNFQVTSPANPTDPKELW